MIREGLGTKTGRRMGHVPMSGPDGSIAALAPLSIGRQVFVHINNTNPVLAAGLARAGGGRGRRLGRRRRRHGGGAVTLSRADFEARLRAIGAERYHDRHPFHHRLHSGGCTADEVRAWVINRYYYQSRIPMKDAAFMSRVEDPDLRRAWRSADRGPRRQRRRTRAASAAGCGSPRRSASIRPMSRAPRGVLPATRFAVDAYVRFVRDRTPARGGGGVADRALRPDDPRRAGSRGCCSTTPSPTRRASPTSATGSTRRRRTWPSGSPGCSTMPTPPRSRTPPRRRSSSRPTCSGRSSTRWSTPTSPRPHPAGRLGARRGAAGEGGGMIADSGTAGAAARRPAALGPGARRPGRCSRPSGRSGSTRSATPSSREVDGAPRRRRDRGVPRRALRRAGRGGARRHPRVPRRPRRAAAGGPAHDAPRRRSRCWRS